MVSNVSNMFFFFICLFFYIDFPPKKKTFCKFSFHFLSCTFGFRKTEGHGGRRHQDVCEDGSVSHRQRGGTLFQQVQDSPSNVPGHITTDVQKYRHVFLTKWGKNLISLTVCLCLNATFQLLLQKAQNT